MAKPDESTPSERRAFFKQAAGKIMRHVAEYLDEGIGDFLATTSDSNLDPANSPSPGRACRISVCGHLSTLRKLR